MCRGTIEHICMHTCVYQLNFATDIEKSGIVFLNDYVRSWILVCVPSYSCVGAVLDWCWQQCHNIGPVLCQSRNMSYLRGSYVSINIKKNGEKYLGSKKGISRGEEVLEVLADMTSYMCIGSVLDWCWQQCCNISPVLFQWHYVLFLFCYLSFSVSVQDILLFLNKWVVNSQR